MLRRNGHLSWTVRSALLGMALAAVGCGDDASPTRAAVPAVNVSGKWVASSDFWTLQVYRIDDGFTTSFRCGGSMTLTQDGTRLSGFAVVGYPCAPISFDVTGTVDGGGAISLETGGPPPTEGPCPGGENVEYSGQVQGSQLSARGVTVVDCPTYGEHRFTYLISGWK